MSLISRFAVSEYNARVSAECSLNEMAEGSLNEMAEGSLNEMAEGSLNEMAECSLHLFSFKMPIKLFAKFLLNI